MPASIGIDVGGTKIYAAVSEQTNVIHSVEYEVAHNLADFSSQIEKIVAELACFVPTVERIGVGIPGAVRPDGTCWIPNLPYLTGLHLGKHLERVCGNKVLIANDGQLALLGEVWCGAAKGLRNAVLVSVGTGIGGAVLMDEEIRAGANGTAGSLGWLTVERNEDSWTYYESIASGTALNQLAQHEKQIKSHELIRLVRQGDNQACEIFADWLMNLGMGFVSIASVFDPEAIIITGGLSREGDLILPYLRNLVSQFASPFTQGTLLRVGELRDKATLYGALRLAHTGALM